MKRILSALLCAVMLAGALSVGVFAERGERNLSVSQTVNLDNNYTVGDVDGNGYVNAADSLKIKRSVAGIEGLTAVDEDSSDINADGIINAKDVFYIKAILSGSVSKESLKGNNPVYRFEIAGVDISEFVVVLPEGTTYDDSVYFAFELLREYTKKATGVTVPKEYGTTPEHGIYFHVFDTDSDLFEELGIEGYRYEVKNGDLHIYGSEYRGNIYAVYEILEDHLGFYFCDDYYTVEYRIRHVGFAEGFERQYVPAFSFRSGAGHLWGSTMTYHGYARRLNGAQIGAKTDTKYYGTFTGPVFHNAHSFFYYEAMGAGEMPDDETMPLQDRYYQKYLDGVAHGVERGIIPNPTRLNGDGPNSTQPCATSPDEFENVYRGLYDTIKMIEARGYDLFYGEDVSISYFSFSINDSTAPTGGYCTCQKCSAKAAGSTITIRGDVESQLAGYTGDYTTEVAAKNSTKVSFKKEGYSGVYVDFANRAAQRIQEEYPGLNLYLILYDHTVPESVRPDEHLVLMYCGNGCNQHPLGSGECIRGSGSLAYGSDNPATSGEMYSNIYDEYAIPTWVQYCSEAGTQLYFWYYPESYSTYIYDVPDFFNMYYNIRWLRDQGVSGVYFEGCTDGYQRLTEFVKFEMGLEMMWNPDITFDEYCANMKKFIRAYYGGAEEEIYQYIVHLNNAADAAGNCFYGAFDRLWDMYSRDYIAEHYEEMHELMQTALRKTQGSGRTGCLAASCEFIGLAACYDKMYTNGDAASRQLYEERYMWVYNWIKDNNFRLYAGDALKLPASPDFTKDIATQSFIINSRKGR